MLFFFGCSLVVNGFDGAFRASMAALLAKLDWKQVVADEKKIMIEIYAA